MYFHPQLVPQCGMTIYPEDTDILFIDISLRATNLDLILRFHPHPHILPSREKERNLFSLAPWWERVRVRGTIFILS